MSAVIRDRLSGKAPQNEIKQASTAGFMKYEGKLSGQRVKKFQVMAGFPSSIERYWG
jgi:hypothetical protein